MKLKLQVEQRSNELRLLKAANLKPAEKYTVRDPSTAMAFSRLVRRMNRKAKSSKCRATYLKKVRQCNERLRNEVNKMDYKPKDSQNKTESEKFARHYAKARLTYATCQINAESVFFRCNKLGVCQQHFVASKKVCDNWFKLGFNARTIPERESFPVGKKCYSSCLETVRSCTKQMRTAERKYWSWLTEYMYSELEFSKVFEEKFDSTNAGDV